METVYPNKPHITRVEVLDESHVSVTATCALSGRSSTMEIPVSVESLEHWAAGGVNIQDALPGATPSQREFLMTGITAEMWDIMFEDDE